MRFRHGWRLARVGGCRRTFMVGIVASLLCGIAGCSDGRPRRVPVSGQVLIDGQPLTVGTIRVIPTDARAATGRIDSAGRFSLMTFDRDDGCVPGTHGVEVTAYETISGSAIRWHAPPKYRDISTSGLVVTIDKPTDSLPIELSWGGGKPFIERMDSAGTPSRARNCPPSNSIAWMAFCCESARLA